MLGAVGVSRAGAPRYIWEVDCFGQSTLCQRKKVVVNVLVESKGAGISTAASLMVMIYVVGDVSDAHFNPAVPEEVTNRRNIWTKQLHFV